MTVEEYIVDGLVKYLELERELGVRRVECDKEVIAAVWGKPPYRRESGAEWFAEGAAEDSPAVSSKPPYREESGSRRFGANCPADGGFDFVFIHDRPLTEKAATMMAKIIAALGETAETAPIVWEKPIPEAKLYVILGGRALSKFMPGTNSEPNKWITSASGKKVLVTYDPEYILRYTVVTPAVEKIKKDMWRYLKTIRQHLALISTQTH